jgi:hypothetical protein
LLPQRIIASSPECNKFDPEAQPLGNRPILHKIIRRVCQHLRDAVAQHRFPARHARDVVNNRAVPKA